MDPLLTMTQYALGGLQTRLDTIAHNVANANTPLYRSQRVDFEGALADALRNGKATPDEAPKVEGGYDLVDNAGNSVSLENELVDMTKTGLERQVMVSSFNYKLDLLKAAAGVMR